MMTLDEAIDHAIEKYNELINDAKGWHDAAGRSRESSNKIICLEHEKECVHCAAEHFQLARWLKALRLRTWIPCSCDLPKMVDKKLLGDFDNSNPCIITIHQKDCAPFTAEVTAVYCSDGKWRYSCNDPCEAPKWIVIEKEVTAWMYNIPPYTGDVNEN